MSKKRRFATRTLKDVPLTFEDEEGNRVTENFTVVYRSHSRRTISEFNESIPEEQRESGVLPFSVMLGKYVVDIIDSENEPLTDDTGNKADLSNGFFDTIDTSEAQSLYERIEADIFPQKASQPPGLSGSKAVESEA